MAPTTEIAERFWAKVERRGPDECWPWLGWKGAHGRGTFSVNGKSQTAPRIALAISLGRWLNEGEYALHRCDNPNCVNPAHLWPGTQSENTRDAFAKGRFPHATKTHCARGHPFAGDNLTIDSRGTRICIICRRAAHRRSQNRIRGHQEREATKRKYEGMSQ